MTKRSSAFRQQAGSTECELCTRRLTKTSGAKGESGVPDRIFWCLDDATQCCDDGKPGILVQGYREIQTSLQAGRCGFIRIWYIHNLYLPFGRE